MPVENPTTVAALVERWPLQSLASFQRQLGGDVLLSLVDEETGVHTWSFLTSQVRSKGAGPRPLDDRTRVYVVRPRSDRPGEGTIILLGRAEASDVQIDHPSVSKLHARLRLPGPYLSDSGSRNGTYVEDARIAPGEERLLRDGDRVEVGDCQLRYHSVERFYTMLGGFVE